MRILHIIGSGVVISFLAVVPACALEGDADQPDPQGSGALEGDADQSTPQGSDEGLASSDLENAAPTPNDSEEFNIAATPTCNWVASYAGAWVPVTGTNTVDCTLFLGCNSAAVRQLQHSMNLCYGEHLTEDGDFGSGTKSALIRTQGKAGTAADGQYGTNTRKAMFHERIGGGCIRVP